MDRSDGPSVRRSPSPSLTLDTHRLVAAGPGLSNEKVTRISLLKQGCLRKWVRSDKIKIFATHCTICARSIIAAYIFKGHCFIIFLGFCLFLHFHVYCAMHAPSSQIIGYFPFFGTFGCFLIYLYDITAIMLFGLAL